MYLEDCIFVSISVKFWQIIAQRSCHTPYNVNFNIITYTSYRYRTPSLQYLHTPTQTRRARYYKQRQRGHDSIHELLSSCPSGSGEKQSGALGFPGYPSRLPFLHYIKKRKKCYHNLHMSRLLQVNYGLKKSIIFQYSFENSRTQNTCGKTPYVIKTFRI